MSEEVAADTERRGRLTGLSGSEAARRIAQYGPNTLPEERRESGWHRLLRQMRSPLIYILLVALVVDLGLWLAGPRADLPLEAVAIGIILLLNAALGSWQEYRAEAALAKLATLAAPHVWALRDREMARIPTAELVPGDVVRLEAGDRVPADGRTLTTENAMVDESVLTGESIPSDKVADEEVLAGTLVVRGSCYLEITRTGPASTMGRLAQMLGKVEAEPTPLERRMEAFGRRVARWVVAVAMIVVAAGVATEGIEHLGQVFLFAVALAVAAVPEGLPAVLATTLALGVERMAHRRAVVRRLAAVEALGSVTVIATDKTGTLTENRMEVERVDCEDESLAVHAMVLANDAEVGVDAGDPLEIALLRHATERGVDPAGLRSEHPRIGVRAFDAQWRFMRATVRDGAGSRSYLKGAPEVLLQRCRLPADDREQWHARIERYAAEGFRMLALAAGDGEDETDLEWIGLVLLWDPPRKEVPDAVRAARSAGIRVVMLTGDHPATATKVASLVGIRAERVVTGKELDDAAEDVRLRRILESDVFARVTPEHKLEIVETLESAGEIVAVTGDGVNDAPALKRAHVGIAMGRRGSDVSREVADLVLLDDNFATIVDAVAEGRSIYENVGKFVRFLFSTNLSEVIVVALGSLAAFALDLREAGGAVLLPVTAAQLLWINLITDGAPALALGLDRNPDVLSRPPRAPASPLLDASSLRYILLAGSITAALAFALLWSMPNLFGSSWEAARTTTFLFIAAGQVLFAYPARRSDLSTPHNVVLHVTIVTSLVVQAAVVLLPGMRAALDAVAIPTLGWILAVAAMLVAWGLAEVSAVTLYRSPGARS